MLKQAASSKQKPWAGTEGGRGTPGGRQSGSAPGEATATRSLGVCRAARPGCPTAWLGSLLVCIAARG